MGIEAGFDIKAFEELLLSVPSIVGEEIFRALSYLGEQCIRRVRDRTGDDSWFDRTGNLRSSVGYAVYEHGRTVIESAFSQVRQGTLGAPAGRHLITELASRYAGTYALVVVAGMEYADYVEAMENKDVLASAELWAKGEVDRIVRNAAARALERITKLRHDSGL